MKGRFGVNTLHWGDELQAVGSSHRVYSVEDGAEPLEQMLGDGDIHQFVQNAGEYELVGDFVVCPLEEARSGKRLSVCIDSARNVQRVPRR